MVADRNNCGNGLLPERSTVMQLGCPPGVQTFILKRSHLVMTSKTQVHKLGVGHAPVCWDERPAIHTEDQSTPRNERPAIHTEGGLAPEILALWPRMACCTTHILLLGTCLSHTHLCIHLLSASLLECRKAVSRPVVPCFLSIALCVRPMHRPVRV
eukprot:352915-Chlamydomonas_euryale.AAC.3